jgi:diguanylate cyclase (GGDEF)-like protein
MDDNQFTRAFNAGAIDFLQKPVSQAALVSVIESVSVRDHTAPSGTALVLSNDPALHTIFVKVLKLLNFHLNICPSPQDLETYLHVSIPNIIILDLTEIDNGLNYCTQVRELSRKSSPVIIALAEEKDRNTMVHCFRYGASEFITKPFGRDELKARIENHIRMRKLQDELVQKNRILESLAYRDKLTGLMNRRYFDETLSKELSRAEKTRRPLSFMMMDLDNFKQVNDRYGHDTGDVVLREIAAVLMSRIDDSGIVCRYGGEEFCIIFPEKTLAEAMKKGEEVRRSCQAVTISTHRIRQTISGGIAAFPETSTLESLVIDADNFLYKAKQSGRNRIVSGG